MKEKTIFFFVGSFKVGGTEKVASLIAESLINLGYDVKILLLKNTIELPVDNLMDNILHLNTQDHNNRFRKVMVSYSTLWKYYFKYKPHRIVSFSSELNMLLLFSFLPNLVFTVDTNLFWVRSKLYRRRIMKIIGRLPNVYKVIVPSHELRLRFKNYVSKKSFKKLVTIHNPVNNKDIKYEPLPQVIEKPYFVSVGRLDINKGFKQLIHCFSRANFNRDYNLYILGSGPMETELKQVITDLNIGHKVKLLGFKEYPQNIISNAEALILNSNFESFGNVLVEALSLGTPVISNDCNFGPREIIEHGTNGLLYKKEKDKNLIKVLEEFANSDTLRCKLKHNTSYKLDRFDSEKITKQWIEKILK